jgi:hypothetical protein
MPKSNPNERTQKQPEPGGRRDQQSSGGQLPDQRRGQNHGQRQTNDESRDNDAHDMPRDGKGRFISNDE